jgi:two-component SAPR family response regulator
MRRTAVRVLVIEDEAFIAFEICDMLAHLGHEHIDVQTTSEAVRALRETNVDLTHLGPGSA